MFSEKINITVNGKPTKNGKTYQKILYQKQPSGCLVKPRDHMSHDHLTHDQRKFKDHSDNLSLTARNEYLSRVSFLANHRSYIEKKASFAVNEIYKKIYGANLALKI